MAQKSVLNRRSFLKNAQLTALAGAVGTQASAAVGDGFEADATGRYDFDTPYDRVGSDSVKWDRQIRLYGRENIVAGMGIADMDFRCAPAISKALAERVRHENWGYLDLPKSYTDGIINWNKRRHGIDINPELLLVTDGVHPGIISVLKTFSPPGSRVLLQTPAYDGFYGDISFAGCRPEECPLKPVNGRYAMDFEDLERRIGHDTNTLILCNPHNPTGNCWSREDLTRLGEICTRRRVLVLADEIHCDFVTKGNRYTPYCTLDNREIVMNSITFKAASKSFGLSAMKNAWMFSDNRDLIDRVKANHRPVLNTLGIVANQAAYAEGADWLEQVATYIDGNHDFVQAFTGANIPLIKTAKAQGTYLSWLDISGVAAKIGAAEMAADANRNRSASEKPVTAEMMVERWFVRHAKVQLNPGTSYGLGGAGHMRMNIATSRKTLALALTNMANALKKA
jgi:cysteine-S-conjugate beta-lyase